jgi:hypothetical protein
MSRDDDRVGMSRHTHTLSLLDLRCLALISYTSFASTRTSYTLDDENIGMYNQYLCLTV